MPKPKAAKTPAKTATRPPTGGRRKGGKAYLVPTGAPSLPPGMSETEAFAHLVGIHGLDQSAAAKLIRPHLSPKAARDQGYDWGKACRERIAQLRGASAAASALTHGITRASLIKWWDDIRTTPIGRLHAEHPLAQKMTVSTTRNKDGTTTTKMTVEMPDKATAGREIGKLLHFYEPPAQVGDVAPEDGGTAGESDDPEKMTVGEFMRRLVRPGSPIDHYREDVAAGRIVEVEARPALTDSAPLDDRPEEDEFAD